MPPSPGGTLALYTDVQLNDATIMAELACGKSHSAVKGKGKQVACTLVQLLKIERAARGLPPLPSPPQASNFSASPQSL